MVVLLVVSCFFYCSAATREFLSFPTRRSSDLAGGLDLALRLLALRRHGLQERVNRVQFRVAQLAEHARHRFADLCPVRPHVDRKSTRLNSSHSQISYAVFCLKKKI